MWDTIFNEYEEKIEEIKVGLVNTNILVLSFWDYKLLINLVNEEKEESKTFPYFFCYDNDALYLNKNIILVIDRAYDDRYIWEYTILNKEGINIGKYEYSKKIIFLLMKVD